MAHDVGVTRCLPTNRHTRRIPTQAQPQRRQGEQQPAPEVKKPKVTDVLKKSIGFDIARGDMISVKHLQIDRSKQFEAEDEELRAQIARRKLLIGILITLIALAIAYVAYIFIKREIERRRRLREEELAARQAMMRDAALRAIEEEGVEVELSIEEQARRAMIENAINLAKERPDDVVQLLRTWLSED